MDEAADADLLGVIGEVRPQVLVTYDANGFYGHPDHIQAHRVTMRAFQRAVLDDGPAKFYATATVLAEVATEIDASAYLDSKLAAMRAHATEIAGSCSGCPTASGTVGVECYTLLACLCAAGPAGPGGRETDLFAQ